MGAGALSDVVTLHAPATSGTYRIVNGDTLTDIDIAAVVDDHQRSGALVTMAVVPNDEPEKYGGAVVKDDGSVVGFVRRGSKDPSWHFVGVQAAEVEAFASVPADTPYETVSALYPALIAERPGSVGRRLECVHDRVYRHLQKAADAGRFDPVGDLGHEIEPGAGLVDRERQRIVRPLFYAQQLRARKMKIRVARRHHASRIAGA